MFADLLPSFMVVGIRRRPAAAIIERPVSVPPVKLKRSTMGLFTNALLMIDPQALTIYSTPSGKTSCNNRTRRATAIGACSDGLTTHVFPNARAAAIFIVANANGAFHGAINAATPTDSCTTVVT